MNRTSRDEATFAKGLYAGYTDDLITSTHILPTQIEAAIRHQLEVRGVTVSGFNRNNQQNECDLNTMLYMPEIEQVYEPEMLFTLRGLLVDPLGAKLRNLMSHGLMSDAELCSHLSVYLWAFTLLLCYYVPLDCRENGRPAPPEPQSPPAPPDAPPTE